MTGVCDGHAAANGLARFSNRTVSERLIYLTRHFVFQHRRMDFQVLHSWLALDLFLILHLKKF